METTFSRDERARIYQEIRRKYTRAAQSLDDLFQYPTGRAGLEGLGYDPAVMNRLPERVVASYCGVGNPFPLDQLRPGERFLISVPGEGWTRLSPRSSWGRPDMRWGLMPYRRCWSEQGKTMVPSPFPMSPSCSQPPRICPSEAKVSTPSLPMGCSISSRTREAPSPRSSGSSRKGPASCWPISS
jgi:hypothetical protein